MITTKCDVQEMADCTGFSLSEANYNGTVVYTVKNVSGDGARSSTSLGELAAYLAGFTDGLLFKHTG